MRRASWMAVASWAIAALSAHAAASPPEEASGPRATVARVDMRSYSNASRTGYAHVIFRADGTDVVVHVTPSNGLTLPLHLYTYIHQGSCASLGPRTVEATRRVLGYRDPSGLWTVRNTVALGLDTVRASPHALAVRSGPADGDKILFCGDLRLS